MSADTLQLFDSSQGQEKGEPIGALKAGSAGKLLVVACAADGQLSRLRFLFSDDMGTACVQPAGDMVAASPWRPRPPSSEGTNATDQTSTSPAARTPGPVREMVRQQLPVTDLSATYCNLKPVFLNKSLANNITLLFAAKRFNIVHLCFSPAC